MLGRIWVFITPRTIAMRLRGFENSQDMEFNAFLRKKCYIFSYFEEKHIKKQSYTP
jgi:hypothetical protein